MSIGHIKWLLKELPQMTNAGLIDKEHSDTIRLYYQKKIEAKTPLAILLLAILGALLLGGGVILIFAHNWEDFSRPLRAFLSFLPLLIAHSLGAVYFWKNRQEAWAESVALFTSLAVAAALGLVSQTYHIEGSLSGFILTWMILSLPLIYLFRSISVTLLYFTGITTLLYIDISWWSSSATLYYTYWPLLLGIIPFWIMKYRSEKGSASFTLINWFLGISLICASFMALPQLLYDFRAIIIVTICASLLLFENLFFTAEVSSWHSPFRVLGKLGLLLFYIIFSYFDVWKSITFRFTFSPDKIPTLSDLPNFLTLFWLVVSLFLLIQVWRKKDSEIIILSAGFPLILTSYFFSYFPLMVLINTALANIYLLLLGVYYLHSGLKTVRARTTNLGVFLIAAVIILRFFDVDLSFLIRGIIFMILGAAFLYTNHFIIKKKGLSHEK